MFLGVLPFMGPVIPHELPVILPSRFDDALPRSATRAEGSHKRVVLATEDHYVRIRLVEVVVERGKE